MQVNWKKHGMVLFILLIVPIIAVLGVEFIQRGTMSDTLAWMQQSPMIFALNALIIFCLLALIYSLVGSLIISLGLTAVVLSIISLISYFKMRLRGEPFFPWDILFNKESVNILPLLTSQAAMIRIGCILGIIVVIFLLRIFVPRLSLPIVSRAALMIVAIIGIYAFSLKTPLAHQLLNQASVQEITWNQQQNYNNNGLTLAFTLNVKNSIVAKPAGYGETEMASIAKSVSEQNATAQKANVKTLNGKEPNVIFIMSEAFWDPTLLPNVTFSEDPAPTLHRLQKESGGASYLLSPQFGGGTSNVEFEVLTASSMSFLPGGSVPYQQYISKPVPSLASYFEDKGYKSMGIHSYEGWFWNRQNVYRNLGFESFMSKENFVDPRYEGGFIADDEVSNQIIKQVDETDRSMFIYAVTMQNHGPYDMERYDQHDIQVKGNLTDSAKQILETYTQGVKAADKSLQKLIDHFEQSDEPTMIVFYGDHLPMLGYDYQVYAEGGFVSSGNAQNWSLDELKRMQSVPYVTWSNFDRPKEDVPVLSTSFLGAHILDTLQMEKPVNFTITGDLAKKIPGLISNLVIDKEQGLHASVPEELKADVDRYRGMQYDLLFGEKYLARYIDQSYLTKNNLPNYNEQFANAEDSVLTAIEE